MSTPILLIGIGNEYRSDDAVGLIAIRQLKAKGVPHALLIESSGDGANLLELWKTANLVTLIDAASSGTKPGTIYRFDAITQPIPADFSFHSTHAFGVAEAIGLAHSLGQLPPHLIVYAIEGKNFTAGTDLSSEVENAMREVVEKVTSEVQEYLNTIDQPQS